MRLYDLAMFVFCFNLAISYVNGTITPAFNTTDIPYNPGWMGTGFNSAETMENQSTEVKDMFTPPKEEKEDNFLGIDLQAVFSWFNALYYYAVTAITKVSTFLWGATIGIKQQLTVLGVPESIADILQTMMWTVYFLGMVQYGIGRSFREYE